MSPDELKNTALRLADIWTKAHALSLCYSKGSKRLEKLVNPFKGALIGLGALTGVSGLWTTMGGESFAAIVTGVLGVATATVSGVREGFFPPDRPKKLWDLRNDAAALQHEVGVALLNLGPASDADELKKKCDAFDSRSLVLARDRDSDAATELKREADRQFEQWRGYMHFAQLTGQQAVQPAEPETTAEDGLVMVARGG